VSEFFITLLPTALAIAWAFFGTTVETVM